MTKRHYSPLPERGLIGLSGAEAGSFLQALVSNDVDRVTAAEAIYAALLTPQGKYIFDFFVAAEGDRLLLDCEQGRLEALVKRLLMYRLRAKVEIEEASEELAVSVAYGEGTLEALALAAEPGRARAFAGGIAFVDPRLSQAGVRIIAPKAAAAGALEAAGFEAALADDYDAFRLGLGLPDGSRDLEVERTILLEGNFEELNGVDFQKGCFVGQEVTARSKYRGLVKKRLLPVRVSGPLPAPDTPVLLGDKEAGIVRSGRDGLAMALLRLERLEAARESGQSLSAGEARIEPLTPEWASV
jgi:folate-binding protein YgfZ